MTAKQYVSVNGQWPEGTRDGRDIIPTPQEAITGAKRLYRRAMGKPFTGKVELTSGNRHTWIRNGVMYVNPNERRHGGMMNGGWHEIVHSISHLAAHRKFGEGHGPRHASLERDLIAYAVESGFLEGKLIRKSSKEPKPPADPKAAKLANVQTRIKKWESKLRRAETALRKLRRTERRLTA